MLEGLPPNSAARVLRLVCDEEAARRAADAVVELFDPAETAAAAFEQPGDPGERLPWTLEIYLSRSVDPAGVREVVAEMVGPDLAPGITVEDIAEKDWVASALEGLAPVRAGRFLVHGRHSRNLVGPNDWALEIEAALAFGTGHHGTTRGCLLAFDDLLKRRRPRRILDVGTGTGVLAMAAARALKQTIASGDIDAVAVAAARANAQANGVAAFVRPVVAPGPAHPTLRAGGPYDVIFANILAAPLRRMAAPLAARAARRATLILSGLLVRDVPGVLSAYAAQGFRLQRRLVLEGWATLILER